MVYIVELVQNGYFEYLITFSYIQVIDLIEFHEFSVCCNPSLFSSKTLCVCRLLYYEENKEVVPFKGTDTNYLQGITWSWTVALHYEKNILLH